MVTLSHCAEKIDSMRLSLLHGPASLDGQKFGTTARNHLYRCMVTLPHCGKIGVYPGHVSPLRIVAPSPRSLNLLAAKPRLRVLSLDVNNYSLMSIPSNLV